MKKLLPIFCVILTILLLSVQASARSRLGRIDDTVGSIVRGWDEGDRMAHEREMRRLERERYELELERERRALEYDYPSQSYSYDNTNKCPYKGSLDRAIEGLNKKPPMRLSH